MQSTAQGYLIYELTQSPAYLGYVSFAVGLPSWMFILYAGVIGDRVSRRTILILAQIAMMILAFLIAGLVFAGLIQPWHILILSFFLGIANAFDAPTRQSFVVEMIDREDLANAIALNSTLFNSATVVGPAVAGITYALFGPAWCFAINGISYLAVIAALLRMRLGPVNQATPAPMSAKEVIQDFRDGFAFVRSNQVINTLILNMGILSIFGFSMMTLIPAWAVNVLGGDVRTNGLLLSARGLGSLTGALMIAYLSRLGMKGKLWNIGSFVLPVALGVFAFMRWLPLSLLFLVIIGWAIMMVANTTNALVQTQIPDHLRSRVMSIYMLTFQGGMPIGGLLVGAIADTTSETSALLMCAAALLLFRLFVALRLPTVHKLT